MPEETQKIRSGPRFSLNLNVLCYPSSDVTKKSGVEGQSAETSFDGELLNISSGGACLVTDLPLEEREILKVSIPIHGSVSNFITTPRTLVEVRWKKPKNHEKFLIGVRFLL